MQGKNKNKNMAPNCRVCTCFEAFWVTLKYVARFLFIFLTCMWGVGHSCISELFDMQKRQNRRNMSKIVFDCILAAPVFRAFWGVSEDNMRLKKKRLLLALTLNAPNVLLGMFLGIRLAFWE